MNPPPLPWDSIPAPIRIIAGRASLGELWRGCFDAGFDAGWAAGLAAGVVGSLAVAVALVAVAMILRSRQP